MHSSGLTFGIYTLGVAGTPTGLATGPQDDYGKIRAALQELQGQARTLLPRMYIVYMGQESAGKMLAAAERYARAGLLGDLALANRDPDPALTGWLEFIRSIVRQYGTVLDSLQITNEPNLSFMDGAQPNVLPALVQGVMAAKEEARACNARVKIGFGSVSDTGPVVPRFWESLAELGGTAFVESLDYVAHNFYTEVFDPSLAVAEIPASVEQVLRRLREENMRKGGIPPSVPIRIGENGWPTGKHPDTGEARTYERQAEVLEQVIRTVYALRDELRIAHYALFGLRDADSSNDDVFHQFGIMRDDYTPKPAFYTFQRLIRELGV